MGDFAIFRLPPVHHKGTPQLRHRCYLKLDAAAGDRLLLLAVQLHMANEVCAAIVAAIAAGY